jgi:hypothetical protein
MKKTVLLCTASILLTVGCADDKKNTSPTFMFWCFRDEVQTEDYHIPELETPAQAAYIQNHIKGVPGYVKSDWNLATQTVSVDYKSSAVRTMNFEEAIALSGFSVNTRPANPNANLPEGLK